MLLSCLATFAQNEGIALPEQSVVIRKGNKYFAEGDTMNKRQFMGFLQSRDAISYKNFKTAYTLSNVGWGLLACGIPIMTTGYLLLIIYGMEEGITLGHAGQEAKIQAAGYTTILGCAAAVSGVVCLGVGYAHMHNTVNAYNASLTDRKPVVTFNLQSSGNGLGIAMRF